MPPSVGDVSLGLVRWSDVLEPWERTLAVFVDSVGEGLNWMLVGSAASVLHGAAIVPGDVDILVHPDTSDEMMLAELVPLTPYAASDTTDDLAAFASTQERPLLATADGSWLFGRWTVAGSTLEVARIREPVARHAVLETLGTAVWDHRQHVRWRGRSVPVVPLEVQLATIVARGLTDRERAVRARLAETGARGELLRRAFFDRGLAGEAVH